MNKQTVASNVSMLCAISSSSNTNISIPSDLEFDFSLCHPQYSYCSCWHC